jgi:hypothetical protein
MTDEAQLEKLLAVAARGESVADFQTAMREESWTISPCHDCMEHGHYANSASNALASWRSAVSQPSVNHP